MKKTFQVETAENWCTEHLQVCPHSNVLLVAETGAGVVSGDEMAGIVEPLVFVVALTVVVLTVAVTAVEPM